MNLRRGPKLVMLHKRVSLPSVRLTIPRKYALQTCQPSVSCKTNKCHDDGTRDLSILPTHCQGEARPCSSCFKSEGSTHSIKKLRPNVVRYHVQALTVRNFKNCKMDDVNIVKVRAVDSGHLVIHVSCFHIWHRGMLGDSSISFSHERCNYYVLTPVVHEEKAKLREADSRYLL